MKIICCLLFAAFSIFNVQAATTLQEELDAKSAGSASKMSPEKAEVMKKATESLREQHLLEKAKTVGARAPDFSLKDATGKKTSLSALLKKGPVVLTFYRGGWCPYCNLQLRAYQKALPEFQAEGAELVAVTPDLPTNVLSATEKNELKFKVLSDPKSAVAKKYGLVFGVPADLKKLYLEFGIDLEKSQGNPDWILPIPATYVISKDGKITYAFLDVDYKKRAEPSEILKALKALHGKGT